MTYKVLIKDLKETFYVNKNTNKKRALFFFFEREGGKRNQEIKSELLVVALVGCLSSKLEPVLCSAHFKVYLLTRFFPRQKKSRVIRL